MRFSHLLAGLASLAFAIALPTPGDTADTSTALELSKITRGDATAALVPAAEATSAVAFGLEPLEPLPFTPLDTNFALLTRQSTTAAGDALICSPDVNPGPCTKIPASNACTPLPANVAGKVRTIYQNRGSYCEYFKTGDCRDRLGYSDSSKGAIRTSVPAQIGNAMGGAKCGPRA